MKYLMLQDVWNRGELNLHSSRRISTSHLATENDLRVNVSLRYLPNLQTHSYMNILNDRNHPYSVLCT